MPRFFRNIVILLLPLTLVLAGCGKSATSSTSNGGSTASQGSTQPNQSTNPTGLPTLTGIKLDTPHGRLCLGITDSGTKESSGFTVTGTFSDGSTRMIPSDDSAFVIEWKSENDAVATVNGGGLVTAVSPGTTTITATLQGMSSQGGVTVSTGPLCEGG